MADAIATIKEWQELIGAIIGALVAIERNLVATGISYGQ